MSTGENGGVTAVEGEAPKVEGGTKKMAAKPAPKAATKPAPKAAAKPAPKATPPKAAKKSERMYRFEIASSYLRQISDPTRVCILNTLEAEDGCNVTRLCSEVTTSQACVSHHLSILRVGGVVEGTRNGKCRVYTLTKKGKNLLKAINHVLSFCDNNNAE